MLLGTVAIFPPPQYEADDGQDTYGLSRRSRRPKFWGTKSAPNSALLGWVQFRIQTTPAFAVPSSPHVDQRGGDGGTPFVLKPSSRNNLGLSSHSQ
ncbi:hypothetical protein AVEN_266390-1 [Araneus ventricosus]|uniref:Uncharacterized protein n=1 Tax=Araneus ventricosus TaxID=182803 RepID=A0A4Y2FAA4_ARAVE|nr:hypothetical protein AVEN_266390-1 [Araneus ventricosus]